MKKSISLILTLVLVFTAMLGVIPATAEEAPALYITHANLEMGNAPYLYFAVNYSDFDSSAGIQLKVTNTKTNATHVYDPIPAEDATAMKAPADCVVFKYTAINWQKMGDELKVQAMKDGADCGEAKTYSVLEYALKAQVMDSERADLYVAMLNYGANMQNVMEYTGTYNLFKTYSLIEVAGGTINKKNKIIVELGTTVAATFASGATASLTASAPYHVIKEQ